MNCKVKIILNPVITEKYKIVFNNNLRSNIIIIFIINKQNSLNILVDKLKESWFFKGKICHIYFDYYSSFLKNKNQFEQKMKTLLNIVNDKNIQYDFLLEKIKTHIEVYGNHPDFTKMSNKTKIINYIRNISGNHKLSESIIMDIMLKLNYI